MQLKPIYAWLLSDEAQALRKVDPVGFYEKYIRPHEEVYVFVDGEYVRETAAMRQSGNTAA